MIMIANSRRKNRALPFLILIAMTAALNNFTQAQNDPVDGHHYPAMLILDFIKGTWISEDSVSNSISFGYDGLTMRLVLDSLSTYIFQGKAGSDSIPNVGVIFNWPPAYCHIGIIDENHIRIKYDRGDFILTEIEYRRSRRKTQ